MGEKNKKIVDYERFNCDFKKREKKDKKARPLSMWKLITKIKELAKFDHWGGGNSNIMDPVELNFGLVPRTLPKVGLGFRFGWTQN